MKINREMFYYLFQYLESLNFPGAQIGSYISFRSAAAVITSLFISSSDRKEDYHLSSEETDR